MPFVARDRATGARIDITRLGNPKATLAVGSVVCALPDCGADLIVRGSLVSQVRPHFAHRPSSPCASEYSSHPESLAHRMGKRLIAEALRDVLDGMGLGEAVVEYEVPVATRESHRVIDVCVAYPCGWREAHECQLAAITPEELEIRTRDYLDAGIDCVWWLGEGSRADRPENREWLYRKQGEVVLLVLPQVAGEDAMPGEAARIEAAIG